MRTGNTALFCSPSAGQRVCEHEVSLIFDEVRNAVILSQYKGIKLAEAKPLLSFVEEFALDNPLPSQLVSSASYGLLRLLIDFGDVRKYFSFSPFLFT